MDHPEKPAFAIAFGKHSAIVVRSMPPRVTGCLTPIVETMDANTVHSEQLQTLWSCSLCMILPGDMISKNVVPRYANGEIYSE